MSTSPAPGTHGTARRTGAGVLGAVLGLIAGLGFGVYLQVAGTIDPQKRIGLLVPIGGLIVGALLGAFGGRPPRAVPPPSFTVPGPPDPAATYPPAAYPPAAGPPG